MIVEIPVFFVKERHLCGQRCRFVPLAWTFGPVWSINSDKKELGDNARYELITRKLSECAHAITATDNQMQDIKNLIGEYTDF